MSEVRILIARKAQPESVLEALPQLVKSGPIPLDIGLTAGYGRHWTGKRILTFLYADKLLEQSMSDKLLELFKGGKIDRVDYHYRSHDGATRGRFSLWGTWLRTVL